MVGDGSILVSSTNNHFNLLFCYQKFGIDSAKFYGFFNWLGFKNVCHVKLMVSVVKFILLAHLKCFKFMAI